MASIDWTKSMSQTFEYYTVSPESWKDMTKVTTVTSSTITRDSETDTLGSASINVTESLGECYLRIYLSATQNGAKGKYPLGTFLVQTPSIKFDGKRSDNTVDAYTPLIELKENPPPIGYSILKGEKENVMDKAYALMTEHMRGPVVKARCEKTLDYDFVANTDDTWLTYISDLISVASYELALDENSQVLFAPQQDAASMQPVWTYDDGNSSILYPEITMEHDIYGIPNVVEVVYSSDSGNYYGRAINDSTDSPISTVNRGREITYRETNPDFSGIPSQLQIDEYAEQLLRDLSSVEYNITYTHGYCPVRVGDCVLLNYTRAGLTNVKAKVISQTIKCEPGCPVTEKAVFTEDLWG